MNEEVKRDLGPQPIVEILKRLDFSPHDLVGASDEQLTHKMVTKACKGRRLSPNVQSKVLRALNGAAEELFQLSDLFTY